MLDECPWEIEHDGHHAWFQRALLVGDFAPGRVPSPRFVGYPNGHAHPDVPPTCSTCGAVPETRDLVAVEIETDDSFFLAAFREGLKKWPKPTDPNTCWWCNSPRVDAETSPPLCVQCRDHLAGRNL